jgi:hypothetical protein
MFVDLVETVVTFAPALLEVPVLGRILIALGFGHTDETKAIEQLQELANKKKTDRKTRKERNNRYLLKASAAMQCVEDNLMGGEILFAFGKGLLNALTGRQEFAPDIILDKIWTCIEEHTLRQDTPRVKGQAKSKYIRPAKGHGHGRGHF